MDTVKWILELIADATEILGAAVKALAAGDTERVESILPMHSRTKIAREMAEAKARAKFGDDS